MKGQFNPQNKRNSNARNTPQRDGANVQLSVDDMQMLVTGRSGAMKMMVYDKTEATLTVLFRTGIAYTHAQVPQGTFWDIQSKVSSGESAGRLYNRQIKQNYAVIQKKR